MNITRSTSTAPNSWNTSECTDSVYSSSDCRSEEQDLATSKTPTSVDSTDFTNSSNANASSPHLDLADITDGAQWSSNHPSELQQASAAFTSTGKKRTSSKISPQLSSSAGPRPTKKPDRRHRSRSELSFSTSPRRINKSLGDNASPLFFSHLKQQRPRLPHRFSSSTAGATMLNRASKEENRGPKTIQLARGSMNQSSPIRPAAVRTPSGGARSSVTSTGKAKTPSDGGARTPDSHILNQIGVIEVLEQDERLTFILDMADQANFEPGPLRIIYANTSLRSAIGVFDRVTGIAGHDSPALTPTTAFSDFKAWATSYVKDHECLDVSLPTFAFAKALWTCSTLRKSLRLFRGYSNSLHVNFGSKSPSVGFSSSSSAAREKVFKPKQAGTVEDEPQDYFGSAATSPRSHSRSQTIDKQGQSTERVVTLTRSEMSASSQNGPSKPPSIPESISPLGMRNDEAILRAASAADVDPFSMFPPASQGFFDWTRLPNTSSLPRHIQFARSIDWASTSLGPIELWSSELRSMCNLVMASPHPAAMYWGQDHIAIYNEAYILLAGSKHPELMGQSYSLAWNEIWESVKGVFENATKTGQATMKDDDCLFIARSAGDNLEETYFSWAIIPLVGSDGSVVGLYNPAFEKTRRKVAERRMYTLRELGEKTAPARDLKSFWAEVLKALEYNEKDAPFVLIYSVTDDMDSDSQSSIHSASTGLKQCVLEGSIGIPEGHPAAAPQIDLRNGAEYLGQVFREAIKKDRPVYLSVQDGTLDPDLLEGIQWRGFGDAGSAAVCCPVQLPGGETTLGFLVMGVNPRRPYDDDYSLFVQLLSRQLATSMASVVLFEEEIARGRRAAKLAVKEQTELSEQLKVTTQQAEESEIRFTRMAEFAPVGMFIANSKGTITYCNTKWYEITKVPKGSLASEEWMDAIMVEDKDRLVELWAELVDNAIALETELRLKTSWEDRNGNVGETWVLASAYPDQNADGSVRMIFGSITDISPQKWAEHFEKRRMEEALEMKRQQEKFMDITSHEMRNPLSAVLQCADEIQISLTELKATKFADGTVQEVMANAMEATNTIMLCAQHQRRIVDDVLTMSKLDSSLLLVTPCSTGPRSVVQRALRMFDSELQSNDIKMNFHADESLEKLGIKYVTMDPSRVLQVLINLITNAIKFTSPQSKRSINVTLGASLDRLDSNGIVTFVPCLSKRTDLTENTEAWGTGEQVYIHFAVQDTGRGLTEDEKRILFLRFSQASPLTHITYGGSGLGLFISRELVELQGGEIGVESTSGEGSTFAFYIKARRSNAPPDDTDQLPGVGRRRISPGKRASLPLRGNSTESIKNRSINNTSSYERSIESSRDEIEAIHPPRAESTQTLSGSNESSRQQPRIDKDQLKILVVEDNLVNQRVLARQLRKLGCIVHVANHGHECLERLKETTFWKANQGRKDSIEIDVVLMDQEMPVMDGLACTREIRKLERKGAVIAHVPIIAVSANARTEQIDIAMGVGMDDVVSKPFRIPDLIPKVEDLIEKYPAPPA